MPRIQTIVVNEGTRGPQGPPSVTAGSVALTDGQLPINRGGTLVAENANTTVAGTAAVAAKADKSYVDSQDATKAALSHTHTQTQSHASPDTDSAPGALHHTLGAGANQAAAGNHTHPPVRLVLPLTTSTSTYTSMAASENEWLTKRCRVDLRAVGPYLAYGSVRYTCSVATAGSAGSYLRCQWSTDNATWQEFGATASHNVAIAAVGQSASAWLSIPTGAQADIWVRQINGGGNGTASPVVSFFTIQFS